MAKKKNGRSNDFFQNTTAEQRARIRQNQKGLSRQGYYPWGKPPFGFDKVRTGDMPQGLPTIAGNRHGKAIADTFSMVASGEIKSRHEAAGFLTAATGLEIPPTRTLYILHNPVYKGKLPTDQGYVKGNYVPLVSEELFEQVQSVLASWKDSR